MVRKKNLSMTLAIAIANDQSGQNRAKNRLAAHLT